MQDHKVELGNLDLPNTIINNIISVNIMMKTAKTVKLYEDCRK